ncbi:carboxypeptidase-like regulatory domain-containing protein [Sungkyunkwania multivorans]|uniref:Carboxypeptidase-like regulatory domain-containing protein n=1 Tax=Sungkyunkwania multivorans TaxID=1173618 RepID=A0ABW3D2V3_9FLAO
MRKSILSYFFVLFSAVSFAQNLSEVKGKVVDEVTKEALQSVLVSIDGTTLETTTDVNGEFSFTGVPVGNFILHIETFGYVAKNYPIEVAEGATLDLGEIDLEKDIAQDLSDNLITLTENDLGDDDAGTDATSGLLQSTRDVFLNRAAFDFGQAFFRVRGYDSKEAQVLVNGVKMNKMFNGRPQWNNWGGLNDVTRNQELSSGLSASNYTFGGVFGSTNINTKASDYRPGLRLSGSASNRTYGGRLMATYSSGVLSSGLAYTVSASRRWAEEGFIDGTIYDAYSVFGSLDYRINDDHTINATAFFSPNRRGSSTAITEEVFDLVGRTYNPNWGFQDGEQRNSRVREIEEPVFMLSHFFEKDEFSLKTSVAYQKGRVGRGRIQQQNAQNPNPIYYRYLPSFYLNRLPEDGGPDLVNAELARQNFINDPQVDWNFFYQSNLREGGNGQSVYILHDDVNEDTQLSVNSIFDYQKSDNIEFNGGLTLRSLNSKNFAEITDLLGGTFYRDFDPFTNTSNNLGGNDIKGVGDKFSYNYDIDGTEFDLFGQVQFTYNKVDFFVGANYNYTGFQRNGLFLNEQFLGNSLGKGKKQTFNSGGVKGGLTYKISGNHFITANGAYFSQAPNIRNTFANARVNNDIVPNIQSEKVRSFDASYIVRTSLVKARLTGFYTKFEDASEVSFFFTDGLALAGFGEDFNDVNQDFVSESVVGIDKLHIGGELGLEVQVTPTVKINGAAAFGQFTYTNNPEVFIASDEIPTLGLGKAQLKDYKLANGPQRAYSLGFEYRDPNFWWVGASGNYLSNNYTDPSALVRTDNFFINPDDPNGFPFPEATEEAARELLKQDRLDDFFLVNIVGGKSWRYKGKYISLFASINNALDQTFRTGGFEQSRTANFRELSQDRANGTPSFGPRYFYGFGRTYFLNLAVSF